MASTRYIRDLANRFGDPDYPVPGTAEWEEANWVDETDTASYWEFDPTDESAGGFGESEFIATCQICFDPIDYCPGHGDLG